MLRTDDIHKAGILIVDDRAENVVLLEQMLHEAGYVSIASTTDPRRVCELHSQYGYDLILLDLQMPVLDGFQVIEGLKKLDPDGYLPVLVITAQPGEKLRALRAGAKDFISKPFDLSEVLVRVHNMLEVRLLHRNENMLNSERLDNSQRMAQLGDWEYDFTGNRGVWSAEVHRILGTLPSDTPPTKASFLSRVHPDDLAYVRRQEKSGGEFARRRDFEHRVVRPNGQVRHVHQIVEVVVDNLGRQLRESGTLQDVTDRRRSEEALLQGEARFRQMLMLSPGAHLLHVDNVITFVNRAFCRLTGASEPAQWVGRSVLDVIDPEHHKFLGESRGGGGAPPPPGC
jgi:DNA-binding response OmpR family regulator